MSARAKTTEEKKKLLSALRKKTGKPLREIGKALQSAGWDAERALEIIMEQAEADPDAPEPPVPPVPRQPPPPPRSPPQEERIEPVRAPPPPVTLHNSSHRSSASAEPEGQTPQQAASGESSVRDRLHSPPHTPSAPHDPPSSPHVPPEAPASQASVPEPRDRNSVASRVSNAPPSAPSLSRQPSAAALSRKSSAAHPPSQQPTSQEPPQGTAVPSRPPPPPQQPDSAPAEGRVHTSVASAVSTPPPPQEEPSGPLTPRPVPLVPFTASQCTPSPPSFRAAADVLASGKSPLQKDPPAFSLSKWREEMEEHDKSRAQERRAWKEEVHSGRLAALQDEFQSLRQMQQGQQQERARRETEARALLDKAENLATEWKRSFAKLSPSLVNVLEAPVGTSVDPAANPPQSWKEEASPVIDKIRVEQIAKEAEEQKRRWELEKHSLEHQRSADLKEQEKAFNRVLEQKGDEQAAMVRMFYQKLEEVSDSYEAQLELSNAESDRIVTKSLFSPPRPASHASTPHFVGVSSSPRVTSSDKCLDTPTRAAQEFGLNHLTGELGFSDSEVERQAEAVSNHFARLQRGRGTDGSVSNSSQKKKRKKKGSSSVQTGEELCRIPCGHCGAAVPSSNFCGECGAALTAGVAGGARLNTTTTTTNSAPLQRYMPSPVVDSFLEDNLGRYSHRHMDKKLWEQAKAEHVTTAPRYPNGQALNYMLQHPTQPFAGEAPHIAPQRR
eukprot:TRINITY_DN20379_c0_g1_i1.p1 TRINITY_DN20379_c0_g1~~TRINITY_DN20379_c0_g1_i1.p1  ORF type:complete len:741 (+),score=78.87 TRINITY_DN20379_c0_g1_i1:44-2224(+)